MINDEPNYDYKIREDLEEEIIGSILIADNLAIKDIVFNHGFDSADYFKSKIYSDIFSAILECWKQNMIADLKTVVHNRPLNYRSKENRNYTNSFDLYCIAALQKVSSSAKLEFHLWILKQYVIAEYWNKTSKDILGSNWDVRDSIIVSENIINGYQLLFDKLSSSFKQSSSMEDVKESARKSFENAKKGIPVGLPCGIIQVDNFTQGFQPSEFTIMAARPGMGKTTVSLKIARNMAFDFNKKGKFFSLEMTKKQLLNRLIAGETGIEYDRIKAYSLSDKEFDIVMKWYDFFDKKSNLEIIDNMNTLIEIISYIQADDECEFAVIDYLQLVSLDKKLRRKAGNREQEVSEISKTTKACAKNKNIPIIALSQLSRAVELRTNKRPMLSDLRESGSLEQDADNVVFFYREAYYREKNNEIVPEIEKGNLEYIIAKGRETGTANFQLHMNFKTYELSDGFKFNGPNTS